MKRGGELEAEAAMTRTVIYCLVPRDLAGKLHEPLRRHFRDERGIEVIVEHRDGDRRATGERRSAKPGKRRAERRAIHNPGGRRVGERRAALAPIEPPPLPRKAQRHAERLVFVERLEPSTQRAEDLDSARLVTRFQAGDREAAFSALYTRYFDRVFAYLRLALGRKHDAEDAAQHVFTQVLEALPRYERRRQPFRAWLFAIARNHALIQLGRQSRVELVDPAELDRRREQDEPAVHDLSALDWISDPDLLFFVERLQLPHRQVLFLRYMLDMTSAEIGRVLGFTPAQVRSIQHRALLYLQERLEGIGKGPSQLIQGDRDQGKPIRMRRWGQQAIVLRQRRFALGRR